jgi:hypothetical protein
MEPSEYKIGPLTMTSHEYVKADGTGRSVTMFTGPVGPTMGQLDPVLLSVTSVLILSYISEQAGTYSGNALNLSREMQGSNLGRDTGYLSLCFT